VLAVCCCCEAAAWPTAYMSSKEAHKVRDLIYNERHKKRNQFKQRRAAAPSFSFADMVQKSLYVEARAQIARCSLHTNYCTLCLSIFWLIGYHH
jgi:hypothetical protein